VGRSKQPGRALLWESTPSASVDPNRPNLVIEDISDVPKGGLVRLVAQDNWNQFFPGAANPANYDFDLSLHSMAPTVDGTITHLAYLRGGYLTVDTSQVAAGDPPPGRVLSLNDKLLTPVANRPVWGAGNHWNGCTATATPTRSRPHVLATRRKRPQRFEDRQSVG
jgi:hypothetical protein